MTNPHGSFIWYELMTADPEAATRFYGDIVGWTVGDRQPGPVDYRIIQAAEGNAGGMLALSQEMRDGGGRAGWFGYFGVDDVDAAAAGVAAAGGEIHLEPFDVPGAGRIAMVSDPQGIPFYVMRGASDEDSDAFSRHVLGHVGWNELHAPDDEAALTFYANHFGVHKVGAMPMPGMGDYSFIAHGDSDDAIGAVMRTPPGAPSGWGFYFLVPDIHVARRRIADRGGQIVSEPMEVPAGQWALNAIDPEGVSFGLVTPATED